VLNFFKSNNPGVVIVYIFYLALFRVCFLFIHPDTGFVFQYHEPLSKVTFAFLKGLPVNYEITSLVLSCILCFIQALLINGIVNQNKVLAKKNYMSGALFILFFSFFKQSLLLTPATIALTCLVICTGKIFSLVKKEKSYGDIFDAGFLIALATLFYFPSILFILFAYIGLATVRPFTYREWFITLLGFISPFILVFTIYFWNDNTALLWKDIANNVSGGWLHGINHISPDDFMTLGFLLLSILASLAFLPTVLYSTLIQVRKFTTALIFFIFLVVISIALQQTVNMSHFVWMGLPLSILSAMIIYPIKRKWITEVIHLILILLVLAGQYLPLLKNH